jgi:hypothetical protein
VLAVFSVYTTTTFIPAQQPAHDNEDWFDAAATHDADICCLMLPLSHSCDNLTEQANWFYTIPGDIFVSGLR